MKFMHIPLLLNYPRGGFSPDWIMKTKITRYQIGNKVSKMLERVCHSTGHTQGINILPYKL